MEIDKVFEPSKDEAEVAELVGGWNKAVKCTISFAE